MQLRSYQKEAIKNTYHYLKTQQGNSPIIEVFTGGGKSLIMAKIILDMLRIGRRVLSVTHVRELIQQNYDEFKNICPDSNATIYSAGLNKKNSKGDVVFAGVQSFCNGVDDNAFDLILIDECDLVSPNEKTRYRKLIDDLKSKNEKLKIIGLTATPYRMDSGYIYAGDDAIFDGVSHSVGYKELLEGDFLCPIITKQSKNQIDVSMIAKRGGEYIESQLASVASKKELVESSIAEIVDLSKDRNKWLIFSSGVDHSELLRVELLKYGIEALTVNGKTPKKQRDHINNKFKSSPKSCLISVGTHTTGFNCPDIDMIAIVRATMSTRLMVQMIGRGVRIAEDKENLLLLDFGNNIMTHGFLDDLRINEKARKSNKYEEKPMVKECPNCQSVLKIFVRECQDCGYIYESKELNHDKKAYCGSVLKSDYESIIYNEDISSQSFFIIKKEGKPPIIKCVYMHWIEYIYDWISLKDDIYGMESMQNEYALKFGIKKVIEHGGNAKTLSEAKNEWKDWKMPKKIIWKYKDGFKKIIAKEF